MKNRFLSLLALAAVTAPAAFAVGTADASVSGGLDNTSATFALIKPVAIGIVVFLIARKLLRKV